MGRTILFVVAVAGWATAVAGGEFTYVFDGEGQYADHHTREWTQCLDGSGPDRPDYLWFAPPISGTLNGNSYTYSGSAAQWYDGSHDFYHVIVQSPTFIDRIKCLVPYWTWRVDYTDGAGENGFSYWGSVGALDERDPLGEYSVDASDAAIMFAYWGTPVADFTGDAMTDAADAGRLFEEWTGDPAPASVPEPSGLAWLLLALPLLRKRDNV